MKYWDSSALLPLFVEEPQGVHIRELLEDDSQTITWWGTPVECFSALERMKRMGEIDAAGFQLAKERLGRRMNEIDFVSPARLLRERSIRLLAVHPLKAGDALQLAAALHWVQDQTRGAGFITLDTRLRSAALAEGFSVFP